MSGVVRDASGNPVSGVRIALMTSPGTLLNIGQTEASGRYRLENVSSGRYYVVAGRVDKPTYYPGTLNLLSAETIVVREGTATADMNIVIRPESREPQEPPQVRRLPIIGDNILDLLQLMGSNAGVRQAPSPPSFTFRFERLVGRKLFFTTESGGNLESECAGCSLVVARDSISRVPAGSNTDARSSGIEFRLKDGGKELEFTCRASRCALGGAYGGNVFKPAETGTILVSLPVLFHVVP